ncbi:hypothetical protein MYBA111488_20500 [Mycobacterium basiliense]
MVRRVVGGSLGWLGLTWICLVPALDGPLCAGPSSGRALVPETCRADSGGDGCVGSWAGRGVAATSPAVTGGRPLLTGRLRSSGRCISPNPIRVCSRRIQRGAHQQSSPSSFITDGTKNIRTTVASNSSAAINPNARYFIITRSENTNEPATTASTSAAAVMRRPVVAVPIRMAS